MPEEAEAGGRALLDRHDLKQILILLKQLNIEEEINDNKLLPNLDLAAGVPTSNGNDTLRGAEGFRDTNNKGSWFVGINFTFPLQNREAKTICKKRGSSRIAGDRFNKAKRSAQIEIREALHNLALARDGIPIAQSAMHSARTTLQGELARFEMGGVNNRDLLGAQDALGQQESAYRLAVAEYNIALAECHHAQASLLEHFHIIVDKDTAKIP